jgi:hypothetical protein
MAAIRETFEESGILLAKNKSNGTLLNVPEKDREEGRKAIHSGKITFPDWLDQRGGVADTGMSLNTTICHYTTNSSRCSSPIHQMDHTKSSA